MNCRSCATPDDAKKMREDALQTLKKRRIDKDTQDKAIACCECFSDMMARDASERMDADAR